MTASETDSAPVHEALSLTECDAGDFVPRKVPAGGMSLLRPAVIGQLILRLRTHHVTDAALLAASSLLMNVVSVPATAYIVRRLGPESYGQFAVSLSLILATGFLTNLGLRGYFVRAVAQSPAETPRLFAEQLGLRVALAVIAGLSAVLLCVGLGYVTTVVWCTSIAAVGMLATTISTTVADLLQATQRMRVAAGIILIAGLSLTASSVVTIWQGYGPIGLSIAYLVGPTLSAALSLGFVWRNMFPISFRFGAWKLLWRARYMGIQVFVTGASGQIETILVPKLAGVAVFGYFSAGTLLPMRLWVVPDALETVYYPVLSKAYHEGHAKFLRVFWRFAVLSALSCLAIAVLLTLAATPISTLLFPGRSELCRQVIQITVWNLPLNALSAALRCALNAAGREAVETRLVLRDKVIGVAIASLLVWQFGLNGACWSLVLRGAFGIVVRIRAAFEVLKSC